MLLSLTIIFLSALFLNYLFNLLKMPGLIGIMLTGILFGPYVFNFIPLEILKFPTDFKTLALIIILIRAGLSLNKSTLNKIGKNAVKLGIIPCLFEAAAIVAVAFLFLKIPIKEAAVLGFVIASVSPAVVIPQMLDLIDRKIGKNIPTLILAGASFDNVFALTLFSVFLKISLSQHVVIYLIPVNIFLGVIFGVLAGFGLVFLFKKVRNIRDTKKVLIIISLAILLNSLEKIYPIATLLSIMTIGFILLEKYEDLAHRLAVKFNKLWIVAEIVLFVLVGAQVNILAIKDTAFAAILIIFVGLIFRSIGVLISLRKEAFNFKERLFCVFSYLPKATVQAAIGAVPLAYGFNHGEFILQAAVLSILITAPIGTILIRKNQGLLVQ